MNKIAAIVSFFVVFCLLGCANLKNNPLQQSLTSNDSLIKRVLDHPKEYELQIIYTQIIRDKNNAVTFKDYKYHVASKNYFYPASVVKFPIAVLALEKLNTIPNTSINTEFSIDGNLKKYRFSDEISKIFAVSDNEASNNLFEFIGFDYLNTSMHSKGLLDFRVTHRLSAVHSGSRVMKAVTLYKDDFSVTTIPATICDTFAPLQLKKVKKGIGYLENDKIIAKPYDFSDKNYYSLETMHNTLKRIVFPQVFKENERFHLTDKEREFILYSMQNLPRNAGYDPAEYYDGYCKFFMFGDTKASIPKTIKIYNKVGEAYGTLIDCAYIVDVENKVEFLVSATILVNKDGIFNDNAYEYDAIGFPFLAALGRSLYKNNKK
ncbi:serine hydrolase [Flavobacterium restrictum]|uniref:Serine hydrolase n=1 Tax=Flavobacterium restrictum TaxID=2594428 RepID=A0A553ED56_9FLAO|nr:serine hydrolase [Flavobacterium restrictum]TRX42966.1 serine hydrolase [Flavobacterium restrictum]